MMQSPQPGAHRVTGRECRWLAVPIWDPWIGTTRTRSGGRRRHGGGAPPRRQKPTQTSGGKTGGSARAVGNPRRSPAPGPADPRDSAPARSPGSAAGSASGDKTTPGASRQPQDAFLRLPRLQEPRSLIGPNGVTCPPLTQSGQPRGLEGCDWPPGARPPW